MRRRTFITLVGSAVAWTLTARAQQPARPMIGFLVSGSSDSFAIFVDAFKQGMLDTGMVEDRDYLLDLRFAIMAAFQHWRLKWCSVSQPQLS